MYKSEKLNHCQLVIKLKDLLAKCPKLREVRNDIVQLDWDLSGISKIECIRNLEIDWRKEAFRIPNMDLLIAKCVNLRSLGLIGYYTSNFDHRILSDKLKSLCLDYCSISFTDLKSFFSNKGSRLKRFEYHNFSENANPEIDYNLINLITSYCSEVINLRLYLNIKSTIKGLKNLTKLQYLYLLFDITGEDAKAIIRNNRDLKCLVIHQNEIDYEETLYNCIKYCPNIEEISINSRRIPSLSEKELALWTQCKHLRLIHKRPFQYYQDKLNQANTGQESE